MWEEAFLEDESSHATMFSRFISPQLAGIARNKLFTFTVYAHGHITVTVILFGL